MDNCSLERVSVFPGPYKQRFVSYRLRSEYEKPWLEDVKFRRTRLSNYIVYSFVLVGVVVGSLCAYLSIVPSLPVPVSKSEP